MKDHGGQQEADTLGTTVDSSCQASSLPCQVEIQVESQQVLIHTASDFANGLLCDACKNSITKLLGYGCADSSQAI